MAEIELYDMGSIFHTTTTTTTTTIHHNTPHYILHALAYYLCYLHTYLPTCILIYLSTWSHVDIRASVFLIFYSYVSLASSFL